ncbi:hypothetical protein NQ314_010984 [Rhamnusium bicolor]|uniref:Carboxylesterase type B domain-containing protein n=1 Tax=Rhamnusium bicolor TaxID=1586634 RepID=A0AAV8XMU1_9CUCU|nr:hypothetical protein NQ314_010984 [Rhamnusium bicolor]
MAATGNWGLKDQILALKWIFFQRAIMASGTTLNLWAYTRNPRGTAFNIGRILGITTDNSTYLIQKLREIDYKTLQAVSSVIYVGVSWNGLIFAPTVEPPHKDAVVLGKSHENLKNCQFNKVPMIIGFNSQEGIPFANILDKLRLYLLTYDLFPNRIIPIDMNFITDDQFTRPICEAIRLISKCASVYFYRFSYTGNLGLNVGQSERPFLGVGHGEDLNYLWRKSTNIPNPTESDILTRQRMIKLWTNFAKTGNPTPEQDPLLKNVTWTPVTPDTQYYLDIGRNLSMESDLSRYSISWWRELYKQYGTPPYDTY